MPSNADRLWVFENFSRYGAVAGLRILIDEGSGLCNGTGFVNYADQGAAERARAAMNGMRVGDRILHVMVQTNHHGGGGGAPLANGRAPSGSLDASPGSHHQMAAAAAMLAAAAGQQVGLSQGQADWQLLPPQAANGGMMW